MDASRSLIYKRIYNFQLFFMYRHINLIMRFIFVIFFMWMQHLFCCLCDSFVKLGHLYLSVSRDSEGARRRSPRAASATHGGALKKSQVSGHSRGHVSGPRRGARGRPGSVAWAWVGGGAGVTWRRGRCGAVRGCCQCRGRRTSDPASVPAPTAGAGPPPTLSYAPAPLIVTPRRPK